MRNACSSRGGWCLKSLAWGVRYIKLRCTSGLGDGFAGKGVDVWKRVTSFAGARRDLVSVVSMLPLFE